MSTLGRYVLTVIEFHIFRFAKAQQKPTHSRCERPANLEAIVWLMCPASMQRTQATDATNDHNAKKRKNRIDIAFLVVLAAFVSLRFWA